jgi:hypothetical protein
VALFGLGGGGKDGLGELFTLAEPVRKLLAAQVTSPSLVLAPGVPGQIAADDKLDGNRRALSGNGDVRVRHGEDVVGDEVLGGLEEVGGRLVQDLPLEWNGLRQHVVERRDPVARDEDAPSVLAVVVPNLAVIALPEIIEVSASDRVSKLGFNYCCIHRGGAVW